MVDTGISIRSKIGANWVWSRFNITYKIDNRSYTEIR